MSTVRSPFKSKRCHEVQSESVDDLPYALTANARSPTLTLLSLLKSSSIDVMIEFIAQHGDGLSALRDMYEPSQCGLHHVASFVPDLAATVAAFRARGYEAALEARTSTGVDFVMIDTSRELGHMIELYEPVNQLRRFYEYVRKASDGF